MERPGRRRCARRSRPTTASALGSPFYHPASASLRLIAPAAASRRALAAPAGASRRAPVGFDSRVSCPSAVLPPVMAATERRRPLDALLAMRWCIVAGAAFDGRCLSTGAAGGEPYGLPHCSAPPLSFGMQRCLCLVCLLAPIVWSRCSSQGRAGAFSTFIPKSLPPSPGFFRLLACITLRAWSRHAQLYARRHVLRLCSVKTARCLTARQEI